MLPLITLWGIIDVMVIFLVSFAVFLAISLILTIAFRAGFRDELQFVLEDLRDALLSLYGDRQ